MEALIPNQALARVVPADILACIRRCSEARYNLVRPMVLTSSFHWLAEAAGLDQIITRHAFLLELAKVKAAGFGLKGKGRTHTNKQKGVKK